MKFLARIGDEGAFVVPGLPTVHPGFFVDVTDLHVSRDAEVVDYADLNLTQLAETLSKKWVALERHVIDSMIVDTATACAELTAGTVVRCAVTVDQAYVLTTGTGEPLKTIYKGIA